jgi:hypothetical protein
VQVFVVTFEPQFRFGDILAAFAMSLDEPTNHRGESGVISLIPKGSRSICSHLSVGSWAEPRQEMKRGDRHVV